MVADNIRLSSRARGIEPSGIRRIFELMATMEDPINLSIGQAHYDPPEALIEAACRAMRDGHNRYTVTQGLPELNDLVLDDVEQRLGRRPETCLLTSGVSGGLMLSFLSLLDPGDEILLPDPYFVMYKHLATLCGATVKFYDTYPKRDGERFGVDVAQLESLVSERTKIVFVNSPSNPTGRPRHRCTSLRRKPAAGLPVRSPSTPLGMTGPPTASCLPARTARTTAIPRQSRSRMAARPTTTTVAHRSNQSSSTASVSPRSFATTCALPICSGMPQPQPTSTWCLPTSLPSAESTG